jgi:hypothetical protein
MPEDAWREAAVMGLSGGRFTIRWMIVAVAAVAVVLGLLVSCLRWIQYPHISVTILNETSAPIYDLRLSFLCGERTARQVKSGGVASTEIQSGGEAGIFFSCRDSGGTIRKAEPVYYESGNRGSLKIQVYEEDIISINIIYFGEKIPMLGIRRIRPTGPMTVK